MERKNIVFLFVILVAAAFVRLMMFGVSPPSLNWDEVSHGYNAYSILKTGSDQWSQKFPIFNFRAYGDYPTALNLYLTIPFIVVFGLTDFAIRLPHAILGVFTALFVYYAAFGLTKSKNIGLLAAILVAISPWYVFTSRSVLQANLSVFLLSGSLAAFFNRDKNKYFLPMFCVFLFLSLFSYHATRIFTPIFVLGVLVIYSKRLLAYFSIHKVAGLSFAALLFMVFLLLGFIYQNPESRARTNVLSILNAGAINKIEAQRNNSKFPNIVDRIIYNRPVYLIKTVVSNYFGYFSPKFLFFEGGTQYQFSMPKNGLLPVVNLPLFYLGLAILVLRSLKNKDYQVLLLYILLAPIPASLTNEKFAAVRAMTMLPATEIITVVGAMEILKIANKKFLYTLISVYFIFIFLSTENYITKYFTDYSKLYSWSWQYGYKQVANYINDNSQNFDKIIITKKYGEPHEFMLFYLKWDPSSYQNDKNAVRFFQSDWYWVDRFDKFYFVNDWQIVDPLKTNQVFVQESKNIVDCSVGSCLLVTSPSNAPMGWVKVNTIRFLDGKPAFEMYKNY